MEKAWEKLAGCRLPHCSDAIEETGVQIRLQTLQEFWRSETTALRELRIRIARETVSPVSAFANKKFGNESKKWRFARAVEVAGEGADDCTRGARALPSKPVALY